MGVTRVAGTTYPSGAPELIPCFYFFRLDQSFVFCVVFFRSLFVRLSFFFWPLYFLAFFVLRINITSMVSSYSSWNRRSTVIKTITYKQQILPIQFKLYDRTLEVMDGSNNLGFTTFEYIRVEQAHWQQSLKQTGQWVLSGEPHRLCRILHVDVKTGVRRVWRYQRSNQNT